MQIRQLWGSCMVPKRRNPHSASKFYLLLDHPANINSIFCPHVIEQRTPRQHFPYFEVIVVGEGRFILHIGWHRCQLNPPSPNRGQITKSLHFASSFIFQFTEQHNPASPSYPVVLTQYQALSVLFIENSLCSRKVTLLFIAMVSYKCHLL